MDQTRQGSGERQPRRGLSDARKGTYYFGLVLTVVGGIGFAIGFVGIAGGNMSMGIAGMVGMGLIILGNFVRKVGARGLAGSGIVLDPERARQDLEPWSRAGGGIVEDALSESGTVQRIAGRLGGRDGAEEPVTVEIVRVRCRACRALNPEDAKFCNQCAGPMTDRAK